MPSFAFAQANIAEGSRKRETAKSPEGAKGRDVIKPVFFGLNVKCWGADYKISVLCQMLGCGFQK